MAPAGTPRHLVRLSDFGREEVDDLLDLSVRLKRRGSQRQLAGRTVGLLFFRGSLRTRTSLEAALHQMGGHAINLTAASDFWELEEQAGSVMDGRAPEHVRDAAEVLSRYVDALAIRPDPAGQSWDVDRRDAVIGAWARHSRVPVINMESAMWHPLQALADLMTLREHLGDVRGKRLAITWTHSTTPTRSAATNSLLHAALRSGLHVRVAHPPGWELDEQVLREAREMAGESGAELQVGLELDEAAAGSHVIYARSWHSLETYGNPTLTASKLGRLTGWQIDERVMALGEDAHLMHAMPVRRNLEVVDAVLDGPSNLMYEQAENRLHTQKALLSLLLRR